METFTAEGIEYHILEDFPNYGISKCGKLYSIKRKCLKKHSLNSIGYEMHWLSHNGVRKWHFTHRMLSKMFIPNPDNKPNVNHIDGNKRNNCIENLQWCTQSENILHAYALGLIPNTRPTGSGMLGKTHSDVTRKLMSDIKKGKNHPKFKGYYVTPYGRFVTAKLAGHAENISFTTIQKRIKSCNYPNYYLDCV